MQQVQPIAQKYERCKKDEAEIAMRRRGMRDAGGDFVTWDVEAEIAMLRKAMEDAAASLCGMSSAYRTYARRYKERGPTDPFFKTRVVDFERAAERACLAIEQWTTKP